MNKKEILKELPSVLFLGFLGYMFLAIAFSLQQLRNKQDEHIYFRRYDRLFNGQPDFLENIEEIERLKMESDTIKSGLGLIDPNIETIFSKDIVWENINNSNFKA